MSCEVRKEVHEMKMTKTDLKTGDKFSFFLIYIAFNIPQIHDLETL